MGDKGSRFINNKLDIFVPAITEFHPNILLDNPVINAKRRDEVFTSAFFTKYLEVSRASNPKL